MTEKYYEVHKVLFKHFFFRRKMNLFWRHILWMSYQWWNTTTNVWCLWFGNQKAVSETDYPRKKMQAFLYINTKWPLSDDWTQPHISGAFLFLTECSSVVYFLNSSYDLQMCTSGYLYSGNERGMRAFILFNNSN